MSSLRGGGGDGSVGSRGSVGEVYPTNNELDNQSVTNSGHSPEHVGDAQSSYNQSSSNHSVVSGTSTSLRSRSNVLSTSGGPTYFQSSLRQVSLSGNPLTHVTIDEDESLELNKDEMRKLANSIKENEKYNAAKTLRDYGDATTIATTLTTQDNLYRTQNHNVITNGDLNNAVLYSDEEPITDIDKKRAHLKQIIFSPPFRKLVFLSICFVLLVLGIILTIENFMRPRNIEDWVEPKQNNNNMGYLGGGVDWKFGMDAPKPQLGASVDDSLEYNIADWADGTVRLPSGSNGLSIDGYGNVALSEAVKYKDVPFFWGLPFSGGAIMENVAGQCLKLVQASDGNKEGMEDGDDLNLSTVYVMGEKYLNVDMSSPEGIEQARAKALGTSGMADIIHSPLLHEVSEVFSPKNQGRLMVMVRHPVEREFARFRHLKKSRHSKMTNDEKEKMTYKMFAHSGYVADNWMTRTLVQKEDENEDLTAEDMHTAKEILRRKAVIGLYDDMNGAMRHYARYFGWDNAMYGGGLNDGALSCFDSAISDGLRRDKHGGFGLVDEEAQEGSDAWKKVLEMNKFDLELYLYSQNLYRFQISLN